MDLTRFDGGVQAEESSAEWDYESCGDSDDEIVQSETCPPATSENATSMCSASSATSSDSA